MCANKTITIEDIKPGDTVVGYNGELVKVLQKLHCFSVKHCYICFYRFYKIQKPIT